MINMGITFVHVVEIAPAFLKDPATSDKAFLPVWRCHGVDAYLLAAGWCVDKASIPHIDSNM